MPKQSSAMILISHVWSNKQEAIAHSWERINHAMQDSVKLAITAGLKFAKGDFELVASTMRIGYWGNAEGWYGLAINCGNASAVASIEKWKDRKPFLIEAKIRERELPSKTRMRLYIGSRFYWENQFVTVTSFASDQTYVVACSYKDDDRGKIAKRFKISHHDIVEYHAELRKKETEAKAGANGR